MYPAITFIKVYKGIKRTNERHAIALFKSRTHIFRILVRDGGNMSAFRNKESMTLVPIIFYGHNLASNYR